MDVLPLAVPPRLFVCTPTKLAAYTDCPRRYRLTYVDRAPRDPGAWAHFSLGASVHAALARWWDLRLADRTPVAATRLADVHWIDEGYRDPDQAAACRELARSWVGGYAATLDPADEPWAVERDVAARSERLAFRGRVDRLDERDGHLVVVDYKTGARGLGRDEARGSAALALYAAAAGRMARRACVRVELHHLPTGEVQAHEHDPSSLRRAVERAEAIATDAVAAESGYGDGQPADEAFPARAGRQCASCAFRSGCPAGQLAAPEPAQPWAFLPAEVR
jgi:RecB family exonuclease